MYLVVGLGNPGAKYAFTRHNIGFLAIDAIVQAATEAKIGSAANFKSEHNSLTFRLDADLLLVKPQTFMNLSGQAVQALMAFYKIPIENLLVLHDEVDLPFAQLRFQSGRGHGGHNGVRSVHELIGPNYARLKMGVGRPAVPQMEVADYVLQNFSNEETERLNNFLQKACDGVFSFIEEGFEKTQNIFNTNT